MFFVDTVSILLSMQFSYLLKKNNGEVVMNVWTLSQLNVPAQPLKYLDIKVDSLDPQYENNMYQPVRDFLSWQYIFSGCVGWEDFKYYWE